MNKEKKLRDLMLEQSYTIEALGDEIEHMKGEVAEKHAKLWEVIQENDRLTMTYEPYRPEGDEDHGKDFYELIEENKDLHSNIKRIATDNLELRLELSRQQSKKKKYKKCGTVSLDFWPIKDWFRFSHYKWNPGMYAQLCVGPFRFDWFAD